MKELEWSPGFPHYYPIGANQSSDPIRPKKIMQPIPHPNDAPDEDWPAGLRDIYVWKCESTDGRQLESHPISSSRELKMKIEWSQYFPHYNPMGVICCHKNQSSYLI